MLVADVHQFAEYYCAMALDREQMLAKPFHDIRELKLDVAYPFLLHLYHDYKRGSLDAAAFEKTIQDDRAVHISPCRLPFRRA